MAVEIDGLVEKGRGITEFSQWYVDYKVDERDGCIDPRGWADTANQLYSKFEHFKREMFARVEGYEQLEELADGEVISPKPDLPNVSSGETAGLVRRMARTMVQHTPNVEIVCKYDDDSLQGILAKYVLDAKVIGDTQYSNDMQQNLFASVKTSITTGFDCVIPILLQQPDGSWYMKYDTIHYRDVFPEPGVKDVREAPEVFVRRYMTRGQLLQIVRDQVPGWDIAALRLLLKTYSKPPTRQRESNPHQDTKRKVVAEGYELITWYNSYGENFLTFCPLTKLLLRIERNKHPLKWHPVHFLVLEKDAQHPLGKSQVELLLGRQEFQDLMHNGAMKLWYRNINPTVLGFGTTNSIPNLSPGKYNVISNPNARVEPFEVNTQTLLQYPTLAANNLGSMVNLVGAPDQQMAISAGQGMSATPQGVDAQQMTVDITTNNYQKAIESFFSHYCSYALTVYFQELKGVQKLTLTADARKRLVDSATRVDPVTGDVSNVIQDELDKTKDGTIDFDFEGMAIDYWVRCVPGSLVELEDEKQLRILQNLFVPLSQAMPAIAQTQDQQLLANAAATMIYIMEKSIELSGSSSSRDLKALMSTGRTEQFNEWSRRADDYEAQMSGTAEENTRTLELAASTIKTLQGQMSAMQKTQGILLEKLGVPNTTTVPEPNSSEPPAQRTPLQPVA